jgi:hypothetical protein
MVLEILFWLGFLFSSIAFYIITNVVMVGKKSKSDFFEKCMIMVISIIAAVMWPVIWGILIVGAGCFWVVKQIDPWIQVLKEKYSPNE